MNASRSVCDTASNKPQCNDVYSKLSNTMKRKTRRPRHISRILGRSTPRCQNYPSCKVCARCLPHRTRTRTRTIRLVDLNLPTPLPPDSQISLTGNPAPEKDIHGNLFSTKRKHSGVGVTEIHDENIEPSSRKRTKRNSEIDSTSSRVANLSSGQDQKPFTIPLILPTAPTKVEKEKRRQKDKKKRQKINKQLKAGEQRTKLELKAKHAEDVSSEASRFLVRFPLERVSELSGRSVSRNFRKADLDLNDIVPVSIDAVMQSPEARSVYECLQRPIYFDQDCATKVYCLTRTLKGTAAASKLRIADTSRPAARVKLESDLPLQEQFPVLKSTVIDAIEHVLQDTNEPHHLESSQNSEDKIKSLLKPVLRSLGLDDILVTNGFAWQEKIGLRSTVDLGTHNYAPKSDVAIVQLLDDENAKILVIFEAYSKAGQSHTTPDVNRADRVRLLIQGSYITRKESKPSVVFYLTRDKHMETILLFTNNQSPEEEKAQFCYYVEKCPFYSQASWVSLLCQVINLVWTQRLS